MGEEILDKVDHTLIGDQPGSPEGLVDSMAAIPIQAIFYSEFGQFLAQAKSGYMDATKNVMTNMWDGKNISRRKAGDNIIRAENPRLSLIAACSLPYLENYTNPHDWTGGFMGRWLLMYSRRERTMAFPPQETQEIRDLREWLTQSLIAMKATKYDTFCRGLDKAASALWTEWYHDLQCRKMPDMIAGTRTRAPAIAMRVSLIHAWDRGDARTGEPFTINYETMEFAIQVAELHLKSVISLSDRLAEHPRCDFAPKNKLESGKEILGKSCLLVISLKLRNFGNEP